MGTGGGTVPFCTTNNEAREAQEVLNIRPPAGLDENWNKSGLVAINEANIKLYCIVDHCTLWSRCHLRWCRSCLGLEQIKLSSHAGLDALLSSLIALFGPGLSFLFLLYFFLLLILYRCHQASNKGSAWILTQHCLYFFTWVTNSAIWCTTSLWPASGSTVDNFGHGEVRKLRCGGWWGAIVCTTPLNKNLPNLKQHGGQHEGWHFWPLWSLWC